MRRYKANPFPPQVEQLDNGVFLFIEDPDPWAYDTEPVFWTD